MAAAKAPTDRAARRRPTDAELAFVRERRIGHLATADAAGTPAVVPVCYALIEHDGEPLIVSALDEKPKRVAVTELARVRHILARPAVSLVVDDYDEDWTRLAFVHLRGRARLVDVGERGHRRQHRAVAEHRRRPRDRGHGAGQPAQPDQHHARHRPGADGDDGVGVGGVGAHAVGLEGAQQLAEQ